MINQKKDNEITIALADDNIFLRNGLISLIEHLGYRVLFGCDNGKELLEMLDSQELPDIILMDINMPEMNGFEATALVKKKYPGIRVIGLSMSDDEQSIIRIMRKGARGYILKDVDPAELRLAFRSVLDGQYYYSQRIYGKADLSAWPPVTMRVGTHVHILTNNELEFLKLASSEFTYREIARQMKVDPSALEEYKESLFRKLQVNDRLGLLIFALSNGVVS